MKRSVRDVLMRAISFMRTDIWHEDAEHLLHLDARRRAEICDLKARLKAAESLPRARNLITDARCFDLKNKKWRTS